MVFVFGEKSSDSSCSILIILNYFRASVGVRREEAKHVPFSCHLLRQVFIDNIDTTTEIDVCPT